VEIFVILGPVFLLIGLGAGLQRAQFFGSSFLGDANRLTYWVGLPALIFLNLAKADYGTVAGSRLMVTLLLATFLCVVLGALTSRALGVKPEGMGTWTQAAFRGNLVFVGLPLILTMPGVPVAAAIVALAPLLVVYNGFSIGLLLFSQHRGSAGMGLMVLGGIVRNPIIIASAAGGVAHFLKFSLWLPADRSLELVSRMAVPLALMCIGGSLVATPIREGRGIALLAAVFKTIASPLIGYAVGRISGLDAGEMRVVLVLMACPTAAASYTMVRELGGDENIAAGAIVLSTLLSMGSLAVILTAI